MLWVALAGGVRVEVDGYRVADASLGGRQGRRLLARLAWEGRAVHRDELADGVWLDSLPRTWERTLSGVVTRLRRGMADAGVLGDVITYVDGRYTLVGGGNVGVDVHDAADKLAAARESADVGDLVSSGDFTRIVLRVARLPLLPGEDANWVDLARARHHALLVDALHVLADVALRAGSFGAAEEAAREIVHWDPLREAGHQRLMRTLAAGGDRTAVLIAYAACRRVFLEELGVGTSEETEVIYREALGSDPDPLGVTSHNYGVVRHRSPLPVSLAAHSTTLVGRDGALVWLWSFWQRARADAPLTVVLYGPPGAGKRSLAAVFAKEVHAAGGVVSHQRDCVDDDIDADAPTPEGGSPWLAVVEVANGTVLRPTVMDAALLLVVAPEPPEFVSDGLLEVCPLDRASVAAVAEERLGRQPTTVELDSLCDSTSGWPGAVIETLSRWADDRARAFATAATDANASLRAAHAEIADEILRGRARLTVPSWLPPGLDPYRGLLRFEPDHAELFFGREQLVADVLARVAAGGLVTVVGSSGSGKSSLVRAGVIAELRRGTLPGSESWPVALLTPGRDPLGALTSCLRSATNGSIDATTDELLDEFDRRSPSVVVIDQFEELFTLGSSDGDRAAFIDTLFRDSTDGTPGRRVLIALRSDFYEACTELLARSAELTGSQIVVTPPTELELRRIVSFPVRAVGGLIEARLVDQVVADALAAPGALPLVSTALLETWHRRAGTTMTLEAYRAAGGVSGAIATLAEDVWGGLDSAGQRRTRSIFLRLAGSGTADVGYPVQRVELAPFDDVPAAQVLDQLVRRRLVTVDEGAVRLAHEALLREWPRLRGWLEESRAVREGLHHLRRAAGEWERRGRDRAELYRGTRLAVATGVAAHVDLAPVERDFLDASADQERNELGGLMRRRNRLRLLSMVLVVLLVAAAVAGATAVRRQRVADAEARSALAQRLSSEAGAVNGLDVRLLLAVEAQRLDDSPETRGALLGQLTGAGSVTGFLRGAADNLSAAAVSQDGALLAVGGLDGTVALWERRSVELLASTSVFRGGVSALAFSSEGELAAGSVEGDVARWSVGDAAAASFMAHTDAVLALAFQRDGGLVSAGRDGLLRAFAPVTGAQRWSMSLTGDAMVGSFDRFGSRYAQLGRDAELTVIDIDGGGGRVALEDLVIERDVTAMTLSANGRALGLGDRRGGVHLVEVDSGDAAELGRLAGWEAPDDSATAIEQLAFTASGGLLATAGGLIGEFGLGGRLGTIPVQLVSGRVTGLAVDLMGQSAVAITETGETILLEFAGSILGRPLSNAGGPVIDLAIGQDVVAAGDGQVAVLDLATGERRIIALPGRPVTAVSVAGSLLAAGGAGVVRGGDGPFGSYTVIDISSEEVLVDEVLSASVTAVALHPDGELLAVGDEGGNVFLLEPTTGRPVGEIEQLASAVVGLAFRADSGEVVGVDAEGTVLRWDLAGEPRGKPVVVGTRTTALTIGSDGRAASVATASGAIRVDLATGEIGVPMASPFGAVESVALGLDGAVLATGGSGGVLLWDIESGRRLGVPLPVTGSATVSFDETGRYLISGGDDGEVIVWDLDPVRWVEAACKLAGRTLDRDEWHRYLGDRPYDPACG